MADETQAEAEERSSRSMDDELRILGMFLRELAKLDEPVQERIMAYLYSRFLFSRERLA